MLLFPKEQTLSAYMTVAQKKLINVDLIIVKLQNLVINGDLTAEEVQPIVDAINGIEVVEDYKE